MSETMLRIRFSQLRFDRVSVCFLLLLLLPPIFSGNARLQAQYSPGARVQPKIWSQPEAAPQTTVPQQAVSQERRETGDSAVDSGFSRNESVERGNSSGAGELSGQTLGNALGQTLGNEASLNSSEAFGGGSASSRKEERESGFAFLDPSTWFSAAGIQGSATTILFLSAASLAPAFLMMTTSFVRIFVVLGILRQGFGAQGIPGTQILAALALFMTFFIMFPTWERTWNEGIAPYQNGELSQESALQAGLKPIREFMATQLERTGNTEEILLFWRHCATPPDETRLEEYSVEDVPLHVLLPSFMLSELKTAFLIGVQLLIPMLVVDLLVSSILVSMGMFMLPPTMVSLPFKLLLFVLADGWRLVVEMLLGSF